MSSNKIPKVELWKSKGRGVEPGPNELQLRYFINRMPPQKRPHWHTSDALISVGGYGSGKSRGMNSCIVDTLCENSGCKAIIGGIDLPLLKRNTIPTLMEMFTLVDEWDHPAILNRLTDKQNNLRFANASSLALVNLTNFIKLVGANVGVIGVEEPHLLPSADSYQVLLSRLRENVPDVRQIILATNPEKTRDGWMNIEFEMHRFKGVDTSEHPVEIQVGKPCTCQICTFCFFSYGVKITWEKDGDNFKCPKCKMLKDYWLWEGERFFCPGDQQFTRVIKSESMHNKHLPADYFQGMAERFDDITFRIMVKGETNINVRDDYVYGKYDPEKNELPEEVPIDYGKDFYWGLDFNLNPQCSVVCQFHKLDPDDANDIFVVKDELVMYGPTMDNPYGKANAVDVANEFVRRFKKDYLGTKIYIFGDPHGFGGQTDRELSRYAQIFRILTANGFDVEVVADDSTGLPLKERIDNMNNVFSRQILWVNPSDISTSPESLDTRHIRKSLAELKWKDVAKEVLDDKGDTNARRSTNRTRVYCLSHPSDSLSYIVYKMFNILQDFSPPVGIHIIGRSSIEEIDGKLIVTKIDAPEASKAAQERQEDGTIVSEVYKENMRALTEIEAAIERQNNRSLNNILKDMGYR